MLREQIETDLRNAIETGAKDPIAILTELTLLINARKKSKEIEATDKEVLEVIQNIVSSSTKMLKIKSNEDLEFKVYFLSVYLPKKIKDEELEEIIYTMFVEEKSEEEVVKTLTNQHGIKYNFDLRKLRKLVQTVFSKSKIIKGENSDVKKHN